MKFMSFDHFYTPAVIKIVFIIGLVGIVGGALAIIGYSFKSGFLAGVGGILGAMLYTALSALWWRMLCEFFIVGFRIYEELRAARLGESAASILATTAPTQPPAPSWRTNN